MKWENVLMVSSPVVISPQQTILFVGMNRAQESHNVLSHLFNFIMGIRNLSLTHQWINRNTRSLNSIRLLHWYIQKHKTTIYLSLVSKFHRNHVWTPTINTLFRKLTIYTMRWTTRPHVNTNQLIIMTFTPPLD